MRIQLESVDLVGGNRQVQFSPGLNIVTGPIASGKTTLLRLCRAILSTSLNMSDFPREARENVSSIVGHVSIADTQYSIVRPFVSTQTAKVDIASRVGTWRVPASRPDESSEITYNQWLLRALGLPELRVPSAPTQPTSEPTPVTINDYFLYCRLTQNEIDSAVFASSDTFKDIKRRYVFEIIYGIFSAEAAALQEELREVLARIRQLRIQTAAFQEFLDGTPWENRAALVIEMDNAREELRRVETEAIALAKESVSLQPAEETRQLLRGIDARLRDSRDEAQRLGNSIGQLNLLINQLEAQIGKVTRSIVADSYLHDLDFRVCPRCGTALDSSRVKEETCVLCLQVPKKNQTVDRRALIEEQDRLALQVLETRELVSSRQEEVGRLDKAIVELESERRRVSRELDFLTDSYVSDHAANIAFAASNRAGLESKIERISNYLSLFTGLDRALGNLAELEETRREIEIQLESAGSRSDSTEYRIKYLEEEFASLVRQFRLPRLQGPDEVRIDRRNYLPILFGRRFRELSSQGLQVLVNVAHALAHHQTSLNLNLGLPQILFIDGLTSNLGHEGEDLERVHAVYDYLAQLSDRRGSELQIIVADNDVPSQAERFVRLRLEEGERLIRPE